MNRRHSSIVSLIGIMWYASCTWPQSTVSSTELQGTEHFAEATEQSKFKFRLHEGYLVLVKGTIDQGLEASFLLDTGAYPSVIDHGIAVSLGLVEQPTRVNLSKQTIQTHIAVLPSLAVGPIRVTSLTVLTQDLAFLSKAIGYKVDGIVGLDVLRKRSFIINYKTREIEFAPTANLNFCAPFETDTPVVSVRMESQGQGFRVVIDTGGPDLMLFQNRVPRIAKFKDLGSERVNDAGGTFQRRRVLIPDAYLGTERVGSQIASVVDYLKDDGDNFDAVMGVRGTHFQKIEFDFVHRKFCWER